MDFGQANEEDLTVAVPEIVRVSGGLLSGVKGGVGNGVV